MRRGAQLNDMQGVAESQRRLIEDVRGRNRRQRLDPDAARGAEADALSTAHSDVVEHLAQHDPQRAQDWLNARAATIGDPAKVDKLNRVLQPYVAEQQQEGLADLIRGESATLPAQHAAVDAMGLDPTIADGLKQRLANMAMRDAFKADDGPLPLESDMDETSSDRSTNTERVGRPVEGIFQTRSDGKQVIKISDSRQVKSGTKKPSPVFKKWGDVNVALFPDGAEIFPIVRTQDEAFSDTAKKAIQRWDLDVATNGAQYEFPHPGIFSPYARGLFGSVDPKETRTQGLVIRNGKISGGRSSNLTFYFARRPASKGGGATGNSPARFEFGQGDPPSDSIAAFGGGMPLIVGGMKYGVENIYSGLSPSELAIAPKAGDAGRFSKFLIQRSNKTFQKFVEKYEPGNVSSTGKVVVAYNSKTGHFAIAVQPDEAKSGRTLMQIRDKFAQSGYDNVLAYDGSSSATFLAPTRVLEYKPAKYKDSTIGTGIGVRSPDKP